MTEKTVFDIDFDDLYDAGIRGLIFDVDNTLVIHGAPVSREIRELFRRLLEKGFQICILSNNDEKRVRPFAEALSVKYTAKGGKPLKKGFLRAAEAMGTAPAVTASIGDQLFTDVLGANRCGMLSILVAPIDPSTDPPFVKMKRIFEKMLS